MFLIVIHIFTGTLSQDLGACENSGQWRDNGQDSSGSDQLECVDEEQQTRSLDTKPCFILGEDICDLKQPQQFVQPSDLMLKSHNIDSNQFTSEPVVRLLFQRSIILNVLRKFVNNLRLYLFK